MRNLSLKQLQAVAAVARLGTMTRAAQELNVTSAALYARIRQLEEEAGLMLFDRTPTGLKPTDAGREMLWAINSINTVLETCADRLETLKGGSSGRVAMGVVSTAKYFAPGVIAGFIGLHPAVEINLTVGNRGNMVEALRNYEIDFAIMTASMPIFWPSVVASWGQIFVTNEVRVTHHQRLNDNSRDHFEMGRSNSLKSSTSTQGFIRPGSGDQKTYYLDSFDAAKKPNIGVSRVEVQPQDQNPRVL